MCFIFIAPPCFDGDFVMAKTIWASKALCEALKSEYGGALDRPEEMPAGERERE